MNFQTQKFVADYIQWSKMPFPKEKATRDAVYDLRYDLYEVDMNYAGSWIKLVDSDFKDIDYDLDDKALQLLLSRAKSLKSKVNGIDAQLVNAYIDRIELIIKMFINYKQLV